MLLFALGAFFSWLYTPTNLPFDPTWNSNTRQIQGTIEQVDATQDQRLRIVLRVSPDFLQSPAPETRLVFIWEEPLMRPLVGQELSARLRIMPVTGFRNAGSSDYQQYWARRGVTYRAWAKGEKAQVRVWGTAPLAVACREKLRLQFMHALSAPNNNAVKGRCLSQGHAILPALLFGDKFLLNSHTLDLFARADLIHSLALSGQHLALAVLAGTSLVLCVCLFFPQILLSMPLPKLLSLTAIPFMLLYLWIGNAPPSLLRAGLMLLIGALALFAQKTRTLFDVLCLAVFCLSIVMPLGVYDLGLQLSVLSVAAIALCAPFLEVLRPFKKSAHRIQQYARLALYSFTSIIAITMLIQYFLLPVELLSFGALSVWGILNVLWLPILGFFVLPLSGLSFVGLCLGCPPDMIHPLLTLAAWPSDQFIALLEYLDTHQWLIMHPGLRPHWTAVLGFWTAVVALLVVRSSHARRIASAAALLLLFGTALRYGELLLQKPFVRVLDVGQGQAIELVWAHGRALIDGGGFLSSRMDAGRDIVSPALLHNRAPRLDWVFNTHPDTDHLRGLFFILEHFSVSDLGLHREPTSGSNQIRFQQFKNRDFIHTLYAGQKITLDDEMYLQVLHPPRENTLGSNDASLVLRVVYRGKGLALLTGDLERRGLAILLASGQNLQADILVLPHHGSANGFDPALLQAVRPRHVIASCGAYNRYNFPSPEVRESVHHYGLPLRTTAAEGEIKIIFGE